MKKVKLGLIIDRYHLEKKVSEFIDYMKKFSDISYYIEESCVLNSSDLNFDEDVFFVKSKGDLTISLTKLIESNTNIPVINPSEAIWNTMHRFIYSLLLRRAKIPVPDFSLNPITCVPNFKDYIIKNIIDQKNYAFDPKIELVDGHTQVIDKRALKEARGGKENYRYFFYQKFIDSEWEYKIYGIGEEMQFFYKQIPTLKNPNKMESRVEIKKNEELSEYSYKAMEALNLKLTSIDFLQSRDGQFYLTDINSTPNFNYIKNGHEIVGNYLIEESKR